MYYVEFVSQIYYTKKLNPTLVEYFPINTKKYYENFICNFIEKKEKEERKKKEEERVRSGGRILRSRPLFAILQTLFYRLNRSWMFFFFILFFCLPSDRIACAELCTGIEIKGNWGSYWERMDVVEREESVRIGTLLFAVLGCFINWDIRVTEDPFLLLGLIESKVVPIGLSIVLVIFDHPLNLRQ